MFLFEEQMECAGESRRSSMLILLLARFTTPYRQKKDGCSLLIKITVLVLDSVLFAATLAAHYQILANHHLLLLVWTDPETIDETVPYR